jgi:hypothetical protein
MGDVYEKREEQEKLRGYLGMPVTIYLGSRDTDPKDPELSMKPESRRQGLQRKQRGERTFALGQRQAAALSCPFGWQLVYAPEGEHSTWQMIQSQGVLDALELFSRSSVRSRSRKSHSPRE